MKAAVILFFVLTLLAAFWGGLAWVVLDERVKWEGRELVRVCCNGARVFKLKDGSYALGSGEKVAGVDVCP